MIDADRRNMIIIVRPALKVITETGAALTAASYQNFNWGRMFALNGQSIYALNIKQNFWDERG